MLPIIVPLRSRRRERALVFQKLQHAIPAVGLLSAGVETLKAGAHGQALVLAAIEVGTAALLFATIVRSVRAARKAGRTGLEHPHGIDWIEIWAAGILFTEALERWHLRHHIARPIILNGLLTLGLGLFHGRISEASQRRRSLRVTADGLYVGGGPFNTFSARWDEITAISIGDRVAEIRTSAGRTRRINLSDLDDPAPVRSALTIARERIRETSPPEPLGHRSVAAIKPREGGPNPRTPWAP
jgi:hypothetical protein